MTKIPSAELGASKTLIVNSEQKQKQNMNLVGYSSDFISRLFGPFTVIVETVTSPKRFGEV